MLESLFGVSKSYVLATATGLFLFDQYLSWRQYKRLRDVKTRPAEITSILTKDEFDKVRSYGLDKARFGFVAAWKSFLLHLCLIQFDLYPKIWSFAGGLLNGGQGADSEIVHSLAYLAVYVLAETVIQIPFNLYSTFVVEQKHGFNNQTLRLFFTDLAKSLLLTATIGGPVIAGFLTVINRTGESFYFYVWLFFLALQFILLTIYPTVIQPLFNKVEPLPEGELRTRIEELAKSVSFPLTKLFVIDGSKRSNHSNAYFYGFFNNKRIVLFDTLIKQVEPIEEIVAVLAHEIGHWKYSHTFKMLLVSQVHLFALFFAFSLCHKNVLIYRAFGFTDVSFIPTLISFQLFLELYAPLEFVLSFLMNVLSRLFEFQADEYAKGLKMEKELVGALLKLSVQNKGMLWPDSLYSAFNHSHPPVIQRIQALGVKIKAKKEQ